MASAAQDKKKAPLVRRQREDGSGLGNLHDGLAGEHQCEKASTSPRGTRVGCFG